MSQSSKYLVELRDLPNDELEARLRDSRDELFRLQLGQYTNQVTSTAALTNKRRDIARILTVLNGRKSGTEKQAGKTASAAPAADTAAPAKKASKAKAKKS